MEADIMIVDTYCYTTEYIDTMKKILTMCGCTFQDVNYPVGDLKIIGPAWVLQAMDEYNLF